MHTIRVKTYTLLNHGTRIIGHNEAKKIIPICKAKQIIRYKGKHDKETQEYVIHTDESIHQLKNADTISYQIEHVDFTFGGKNENIAE